MALQPTRNNSDDFEALAPIDPLPVNGHQPLHTYFGEPHNALLHYWHVLTKRKWVVLPTFAIVFTLSAIATLSETRLYQATSKVAIFPEVPNVLDLRTPRMLLLTTN